MSAKIVLPDTVDPAVFDVYQKMSRRGGDVHYAIFRHDEDTASIVVENASNGSFEDLIAALPPTDSRWALLNARYNVSGGGQRSKLTLINWVPDAIDRGSGKETIKAKMLAVVRTGLLKKEMSGIVCTIQANSPADLDQDEVLEKVSKFERDTVDTSNGVAL